MIGAKRKLNATEVFDALCDVLILQGTPKSLKVRQRREI